MGRPVLSAILLTRNRRDELRRTLSELRRQETPFELVVVDNGSSDGSPDAARETWPEALFVALPENVGVAGGRNRGIEAATGDVLVFLDDDASFERTDALARIRARFERDPGLGIIAMNMRVAGSGEPDRETIPRRDKKPMEEDYATSYFCGGGCAIRRELLARTGPFAEDYFYGCEELDLAWRAIACGYRIVWAADIAVIHRRSDLERPRGRYVYSNMRNRVRLAVKHLPWRYVLTYALAWWPWLLVVSARSRFLREYVRGLRDFLALLPRTLRQRHRLPRRALEAIRELNGRLLY